MDVETTGLNPAVDEIAELTCSLSIGSDARQFSWRPSSRSTDCGILGRPTPPETTALTGITDEMVARKCIDGAEVAAFCESRGVSDHNNSAADRRFCERLLPVFAQKAWACSLREVDWKDEGLESARLSQLANAYGFFFEGHRALNDCEAAVELLSRPLPRSGRMGLTALLESARRPRWWIRAEAAPYAQREVLKRRGYRWEASDGTRRGAWCIEVTEETFETEREFLRSEIYRRSDAAIDARLLTAFERYSERSDMRGAVALGT